MFEYVSDYCPIIDDEHEICIIYKDVPIIGNTHCQSKKMGFECEYGEDVECPYFQNSRCPIYLSASDQN